MKKLIFLPALFFFVDCTAATKNAVLHLSFDNLKSSRCVVFQPAEIKKSYAEISLLPGKTTEHIFNITHPGFVNFYCYDLNGTKYINYLFYLSPGDDIDLKGDFNKPDFGIAVTGRGSNNNQPLMGLITETQQIYVFFKDTLPARVINTLNADQRAREKNLEKYISLYQPSQDYIDNWKADLPYITLDSYYMFKENNKYQVGDAYKRNFKAWQMVADSLFAIARLNNDAAIALPHYNSLVGSFFAYERERLLNQASDDPQTFYKQWYGTDTVKGKMLLNEDNRNLVHEKIIDKYFAGKSLEYAYAVLFQDALSDSAPQNVPEIFERFKSKYPHSEYIPMFESAVSVIATKQKGELNNKMVFMADNGTKLNTLDEVLAANKGKTILVDMWGTWCGPCRAEIEKNAAAIRGHFAGKGLRYLYIANYDSQHEQPWKKMIAYFDIEGTHLLANDKLTKDIMNKVKGTGFPTMFIIKKDGSYERSRSDYPIKLDVLYKQLDEALAQ